MSLDLHWTLPDPAAVCRTFSAIRVFRSPTADGTFAEVSTPDTRPQLRPDQARYTFHDASGSGDAFYCSSFFNPATRAESSRSEPQRGQGDPALGLISVQDLKTQYLFGLKLADRAGNPVPDAVFERGLRSGLAYVERQLGFCLTQKVVTEEEHPYRLDRQSAYLLVHVDHLPILSVQSMSLRFPGSRASSFPISAEEFVFSRWEGGIEVVPGSSGGGYPQFSPFWQRLWQGVFLPWSNSIPGAVRLAYTAGFAQGKVPADLVDLVAKAACLHVLAIAGDLLGPPNVASSSIGIDGLSQSISRIASQSGNAYNSRASQYLAALQTDLPRLKSYYMGIRLRVA